MIPDEIPECMRAALQGQDPELVADTIRTWREGDEATRADIEAFFEDDGPRRAHEARQKIEDGIPTSSDLESWGRA